MTVSKVARYILHPRLPALLPPMAESRAPEVREALVRLWCHRPDLIDAGLLARLAHDPVVSVRVATAAAVRCRNRPDGLDALADDPAPEVHAMAAVVGLLLGVRTSLPAASPTTCWRGRRERPRRALRARPPTRRPTHRRARGIVLALRDDPVAVRMATDDPVPAVREAVRGALPGGLMQATILATSPRSPSPCSRSSWPTSSSTTATPSC